MCAATPADTLSPLTLTPAEQQAEEDYQKSTAQLVSLGEQWAELKKLTSRTAEQEKQFQQLSDQLDAASKGLNDYYARLYVLFGKNSDANKQVADVKGDVSRAGADQIAEMPHTVALYTMVDKRPLPGDCDYGCGDGGAGVSPSPKRSSTRRSRSFSRCCAIRRRTRSRWRRSCTRF